jgi:ABC-2 type transport system permease protein
MFYLVRLIASLFGKRTSTDAEASSGAATTADPGGSAIKPYAERSSSAASGGAVALLWHQIRFDLVAQFRNPRARFFTMIFPLILLFVFNGVFGHGTTTFHGHTIKLTRYYTAGIMAQGVVAAAYAGLVISITSLREGGILKRRRATPVPTWVLVTGLAVTTAVTTVLMATLMLIVAKIFFSVGFAPAALAAMYVMVVIATIALGCISFAVAGVIKNPDTAQPLIQATMLPLWFISGVFIPTANLSKPLTIIGKIFPLEHIANSLHLASVNTTFGASISLVDVAVLAAWALASILFVARRFSWLPSQ